MKEYWEVFENEPMAQGGCIWDWVDQNFREIDKDGKMGTGLTAAITDRKESPASVISGGNGLVNAVREPHPHLLEVKKIYQNIKATLSDRKNLKVCIKNWYDFSNLNEYILRWNVKGEDGTVLAEGTKEVDCEPHATVDVTLGAVKLPNTVREAYLNLSWSPQRGRSASGYRLGSGIRPVCTCR